MRSYQVETPASVGMHLDQVLAGESGICKARGYFPLPAFTVRVRQRQYFRFGTPSKLVIPIEVIRNRWCKTVSKRDVKPVTSDAVPMAH